MLAELLICVACAMPGDTVARTEFNIPEQPMPAALAEFSRQAGIRVQFDQHAAAGLRSHAVVGNYSAPAALRLLLTGTGLDARFENPTLAVVTTSAETPVYTLPALTVVGAQRGYATTRTTSAMKTDTPLRDTPQSVSIIMRDVIADQSMQNMADVVRYVPGITMGQGEGNRDAPTIRGNSSTADFFVDGVRDDVQYFRDLYNVDRVEALKGANAMIFGRGGGGGVLNRVTKTAQWSRTRALTVETGSFEHRRTTLDVGQAVNDALALRFNGMYENSGGFRDNASLERYGLNPTLALALGGATTLHAGYEHFSDDRTADRGIPSFDGAPSAVGITTYFGNPDSSYVTARVDAADALVEHISNSGITLRNRTRFARYDKFYQNSLPRDVDVTGTRVTLAAYNNSTERTNLFNQTDVISKLTTGAIAHTLLVGAEFGRQTTDNFRNTGYYNGTETSFSASLAQPTVTTPIVFRQSATDADSRTIANIAAGYAQDQIALSDSWQLIAGIRFDRFGIEYHNHRDAETLERVDQLVSPRAGIVFKPARFASLYGSYSVSYLPSAGDQFGSLNASKETLDPEQFTNYEVGAKWDLRPNFALTAAVYRLDRTNTTAPDPNDPARVVQTGSQRTRGLELGASGTITQQWQMIAGAAFQDAEITSTTTSADAGAEVPLVPAQTFSLWNRYQLREWLGVGVGVVHQAEMYAAIDNSVVLPAFTRADAGVFLKVGDMVGLQVNVENVFDTKYYATSHGNNNIMPGASRALRFSLHTRY